MLLPTTTIPSAASTPELKPNLLTFFSQRRCLPRYAATSPLGSSVKTTPSLASSCKRNGSALFVEETLRENTGTRAFFDSVNFGSGFGFASFTLLLEHPTSTADAIAIAKGSLNF